MKALSFVARRAGIYAGLLLLLLLLTFLVYQASPTEPALFVYPNTQHPTDAQLARGNHLLGFDRPLLVQFGDYVWHLLRGDFGHAWQGSSLGSFGKLEPGPPIRPLVSQAVAVSASTVLGGAVLLALLAVPLGLFTARRPRGLHDRIVGSATLLGVTVHPLVMALLLQLFLARRFHLLPQAGYCPLHRGTPSDAAFRYNLAPADCHGPVAWASHLVLPWATSRCSSSPSTRG